MSFTGSYTGSIARGIVPSHVTRSLVASRASLAASQAASQLQSSAAGERQCSAGEGLVHSLQSSASKGSGSVFESRAATTLLPEAAGTLATVTEAEWLAPRDLTDVGCFINTVRGNLGPGCLSLPHAFADTGLYLSLGLALPIIGLCIFSMRLLLWAKQEVVACGLTTADRAVSYSDVAVAALGPVGRVMVEAAVLTGQLGCCVVYYSFVSENLCSVFPGLHPRLMILAMMPVASGLTLLRTPGKLAILSLAGNVLMISGIAVVLASLAPKLSEGLEKLDEQPRAVWSTAPAFASNMVFSFEGIALTIPMEIAMVNQEKFPKILTSAMFSVAAIFLVVAIYCLVGLGGVVTSGSISASLEGYVPQEFLAISNLVLAAAVLSTYPLQFYPAIEILDCYLEGRGVQRTSHWFTFMRLIVSVACGLVALVVPNVGLLISLVGSLGQPVIGLLLPPLIHLRTRQTGFLILILDVICLGVGSFVILFGTYSSVRNIIESM